MDEGNVPDSKESSMEFSDSIQETYSDLFESDAMVYCLEEHRDGTGMSAESEEYFFYDKKEEVAEKIAGSRKLLTTEKSEQDFIQCIYEDDSILSLARENNRLVFNTPWIGYMLNTIWMDEEFDNYNASLYQQEKDLPFMSRQEAWAEVKELLSVIELEVSDDYTCYVMDHEVMQEQEKVIDVNGNEAASQKKGSWTEEDASIPVRTRHIYINAETLKEIVE